MVGSQETSDNTWESQQPKEIREMGFKKMGK